MDKRLEPLTTLEHTLKLQKELINIMELLITNVKKNIASRKKINKYES